jgi:hypothetical protein
MKAAHLELLVEEPSMEAFLRALLPRLLTQGRTFEIYPFQGKADLLSKLEARLAAYASWLPADWRIVVVVDRDDDDCYDLKRRLEDIAQRVKLSSRTSCRGSHWQLVNRIAMEELESWYFGDWEGVRLAYPNAPPGISRKKAFRDPDAIPGGTWEAFERVLRRYGYFQTGLRKIEAARALGAVIERERSTSCSFLRFCDVILEHGT